MISFTRIGACHYFLVADLSVGHVPPQLRDELGVLTTSAAHFATTLSPQRAAHLQHNDSKRRLEFSFCGSAVFQMENIEI